MGMKKNNYKEALKVLEELHEDYPSFTMARHIATATIDYGDIWGMSGKEFLFALQKYQTELSLDTTPIEDDRYIDELLKDSEHLLDNQQEDEDGYQ